MSEVTEQFVRFQTALVFIFFLMTRPPPKSTLFPYATLFRSSSALAKHTRPAPRPPAAPPPGRVARSPRPCRAISSARRDRKSTRLNSSHSQSTYAGVCLKKKQYVSRQLWRLLSSFRLLPFWL